jgi:hypothetical protein
MFQVMRTVNNQGDGSLFGRKEFLYKPDTDTYVCPGKKKLRRKKVHRKDRYTGLRSCGWRLRHLLSEVTLYTGFET